MGSEASRESQDRRRTLDLRRLGRVQVRGGIDIATPTKATKAREIADISVDDLLLDDENPRLAETPGVTTQKQLLQVLWEEMAVDEVAQSIAANGYFKEEPLFVIRATGHKGKYVVVEGNRRLAAVRLLRDESKRDEVGADLPRLTAARMRELETLPVSVYGSRRDLWQYFGFRHINGAKPWNSFAKAKYINHVYSSYNRDLDEIADSIGDRHTTVKRLFRGMRVLEQAEALGFSQRDVSQNRFYFSHLYTATNQPDYQAFLGLAADKFDKASPVPKAKETNLKELMLWLYGSRSAKIPALVRTQNPDLNRLRESIASKNGLGALRAGLSLDRAYEASVGDTRRFASALARSKDDLQEAKATVTTGYDGAADLLEQMESILEIAISVRDEMKLRLPKRRRAK